MKDKVKADLPSKFVVVFDGWSEGTEHYIAVSAAYARMDKTTGKEVPVQVMLSMRPLLADGINGMTAADHLQHITTTLNLCGKGSGNVLCIVGDNCNVNRSMARTLQAPLIGCASHKLNLAVKMWIQNEPQLAAIILKVSNIMKKASTLKVAAQLRLLTSYSAVRENATRWSSTYQMITRFLQIQVQLSSIVDLLALFPTHSELEILKRAHASLKKFNAVTIMLQKEGMSFLEVRELFQEVLEDFPDFKHYLADDANIVEDPLFEKAIVRISKGLPLSDEQKQAAARLLKCEAGGDNFQPVTDNNQSSDDVTDEDGEPEESYIQNLERRLKRQKTMQSETELAYCNLMMIPGTSVNCERHFSLAKHILTDTRKRTTPALFEALLTLKVNREWWDEYSVAAAMKRLIKHEVDTEDDDNEE
jgi:hypothetical protein